MTPEQALNIMIIISNQVQVTLEQGDQVREALTVLRKAITPAKEIKEKK